MFPRRLETDLPPLTLCTGGRGGAESTVKMSEPEQPPFTVLPAPSPPLESTVAGSNLLGKQNTLPNGTGERFLQNIHLKLQVAPSCNVSEMLN